MKTIITTLLIISSIKLLYADDIIKQWENNIKIIVIIFIISLFLWTYFAIKKLK